MEIHLGGGKPSLYFESKKASHNRRLRRSSKRVLLLCLLFFTALTMLSASTLKWSWSSTDDAVKYYRYQLNGRDDERWTVVDSSVTSVTLDSTGERDTLYVEASYDGASWSESAEGTYTVPVEEDEKKEEKIPNWNTKKYEVTYILSPFSYQYVRYTGNHNPQTRASYYGLGAGLGFNYNVEENYSTGVDFLYMWHNYKDFHYYHSFKLSLSMRYRVFISENLRYRVYLSHSIGADFVLRDDGDRGVYAIFGIIGVTEDVKVTENVSFNWGGNLSYTFQNGSNVLHFTPSVGVTYHFGEDAECREN